MRKNFAYLEYFWSVLYRIRIEYGYLLSKSQCSVRMRENTDQKISENGHFSRSEREGEG